MGKQDCPRIDGDLSVESLIIGSSDAIIGLTHDGKVWCWNPAAEDLFKVGKSVIIGKSISNIKVAPSGDLWGEIQEFRALPFESGQRELEVVRADASIVPVWLSISAVSTKGQEGNGLSIIVRDMSEKRRVEGRISEALIHRNELLKELHHRVKNNLQLICSLLRLQSKEAKDDHAVSLLRKSEDRIRSLAVVHDTLYKSPDFSSINFGACLRELIAQLVRGVPGLPPGFQPIFDLEEIELPIDSATTCALIANELSSTYLEGASNQGFPDTFFLKVALKRVEETLELSLYRNPDDAVASPLGENSSLGVNLVQALLKQVGGSLSSKVEEGRVFTATIPLLSAGS